MSLNNGLFPLNGYRERFAMDIQNPFNSLVLKSSLRINLPHGGSVGKKLIEQVKDLITNSHDTNYMPDSIPESAPGEIPNDASIKKAFNTIQSLRDENVAKRYFRIEELGQNCRINTRHNSFNLKRFIKIKSSNISLVDSRVSLRDEKIKNHLLEAYHQVTDGRVGKVVDSGLDKWSMKQSGLSEGKMYINN